MKRAREARLIALPLALLAGGLLAGCGPGAPPPIPAGLSDERALELSLARYEYDLDLLLTRYPSARVPALGTTTLVGNRVEWSEM